MESKDVIRVLSALAQESRLAVYRLLMQVGPSGLPAGRIAELANIPPSSLSFHLKELSHAGLLSSRQESRFVIYSANFSTMNAVLGYLAENCCEGLSCVPACDVTERVNSMNEKIYNVLVLCTGNSARSIMAEALINTIGKGKFRAYSAGSHPAGAVNPFAIEQARQAGYTADDLRSKGWDEFAGPNAPHMDFVITVCDNAAGEVCPVWPGHPVTAHWGFEDPAKVEGSDEEKRHAFAKVGRQISTRVQLFCALPIDRLDRTAIKREVDQIGQEPKD